MEWKIEYDNDAGEDYFCEWWAVFNDERTFKCDTEEDALWLKAILEKVP